MSDNATSTPAVHAEHHGPNVGAYLAVFGALSVFTALSFVFNTMARHDAISHLTSFFLILGVAIIKALLVAAIFMHLKWDFRKLYILIVPALVLGPLLVIVLLPDIVLAWRLTVAAP
jgi:caa(3)-type oxidase subunit IV